MAKSKLQAVVEETSTQNAPSVTTAVKSIANVLLGPRGKTPIDNIIQMQHYQLWGFILIVIGLLYIVWLMQKKLDGIDKQYKEQFVLLHRLFKSHQDLQVEVRKKTTSPVPVNTTPTTSATTEITRPTPQPQQLPPQVEQQHISLEMEEENDIVFESSPSPSPSYEQEESVAASSSGHEVAAAVETDYEVFE